MSLAAGSSCSPRISTSAWNDGRPDPFTAFENVGRAYLAFAHDEPAYYSAMFEAGLALDDDPGLRELAERSFAVLRRGVGDPLHSPTCRESVRLR